MKRAGTGGASAALLGPGRFARDAVAAPESKLIGYYEPPLIIFAMFLVWVWGRYIQIGVRGGGILGAFRFEFVVGGILILLCLWVLMVSPLTVKRSKHVVLGISLLFFTMIVQIPFAALPPLAQGIFVDRVVKFAFLTFFIAALVRSPRAMQWFVLVWMIAIFWITQEAYRGLLSGALIWQNQGVGRLHGAVPIYAHPNSLGGVAMGAVPFVVFLWPIWKRWWQRLALLALLWTSVACVIYSGSRTAWVAFLAFLLYWFLRSRHKVRWVVACLVLTPIGLFAVPEEYKERFRTIGAEDEELAGGSQIARRQILEDAWDVFLEQPAGVGLGCFPVVRVQKFGRRQDTHNLYLEVATNLGVQGFVVFLYFVGAMMVGYFVAFRGFDDQQWRLRRMLKIRALPRDVAGLLNKHYRDLEFLKAVANAAGGFVFVRLWLGGFGMDLYEVYWWFGAGIAISLLEMGNRTARCTAHITGLAGLSGGTQANDATTSRSRSASTSQL